MATYYPTGPRAGKNYFDPPPYQMIVWCCMVYGLRLFLDRRWAFGSSWWPHRRDNSGRWLLDDGESRP